MRTWTIPLCVLCVLCAVLAVGLAQTKTPTALPTEPTPDKLRTIDPCSEIVAWQTSKTAISPWTGPKPVSWFTRRTTTSGTWTVELRRPDGTRETVQTLSLKIPAGYHVDLSIRTAAPLVKDPNKEAVK